MRVLIVNNMAPFVWGGAEELASNLRTHVLAAGHEAEVLRIPFQWQPATRIPSQMLMVKSFELWNTDRVVALKFPAYLIRHPRKTLWLLHQYRQAYDLYNSGHSNLAADAQGVELRQMIKNADEECFRECHRIFAISETTRQRLLRYNGSDAEVLLPPVNDPELFSGGESKGYIFAGGRINGMKRQHLLLEALALAPRDTKLVIAGPPDTAEDALRLQRMVESLSLGDKVELDMRFLARSELAGYVNRAAACAYLPYDEEFGYIAMEAATAGKALITTNDSGGVLGLVKHLETGWVAEPEPEALAGAMAQVVASPQRTLDLGVAARNLVRDIGISWPHTIERLLA